MPKETARFWPRSMMAQHDANKNGRLDKSEWSKLRMEILTRRIATVTAY